MRVGMAIRAVALPTAERSTAPSQLARRSTTIAVTQLLISAIARSMQSPRIAGTIAPASFRTRSTQTAITVTSDAEALRQQARSAISLIQAERRTESMPMVL